jgi:hypothetical protein
LSSLFIEAAPKIAFGTASMVYKGFFRGVTNAKTLHSELLYDIVFLLQQKSVQQGIGIGKSLRREWFYFIFNHLDSS